MPPTKAKPNEDVGDTPFASSWAAFGHHSDPYLIATQRQSQATNHLA